MSQGSSSKVTGIPPLGAVGQGDSSYKLGRPRRKTHGSPSMSADSAFSSKIATGKVIDPEDGIEDQPMFPYQDPIYMAKQMSKPQPTPTSKGVVLRLTKKQLREIVENEFARDDIDITEERLDEFIGNIARMGGSLARNIVGNVADDIALVPFVNRFVSKPLANMASKINFLPAPVREKILQHPAMAGKTFLIAKELMGDLPTSIKEGREAIQKYDAYMAQNPLSPGEAYTDRYFYDVEEPLREAKFSIIENLIDILERASPGSGSGIRSAIKISAKGAVTSALVSQFKTAQGFLSWIGDLWPGDDPVEEAFDVIEQIDSRLDAIGDFTAPTGELGGGPSPGLTSQAGFSLMEIKDLLREFMELDEEKDCEDGDEDCDDVDEASSGGVAGFAAPLHYDPESGRRMKKMYSRHYRTVGPDLKPKP